MKGLRGVAVGVLTLIAVQVFSSSKGLGAASGMLAWINTAVNRSLSPEVAAIPDTSKAPSKGPKRLGKASSGEADDNAPVPVTTLPKNPVLSV